LRDQGEQHGEGERWQAASAIIAPVLRGPGAVRQIWRAEEASGEDQVPVASIACSISFTKRVE
jgi:hypothetical protein